MRRVLVMLVSIALAVSAAATVAWAAPSLRPPVPGDALLGFGESYGAWKVHSGLDIESPAGQGVESPVAGTVTFAGRLPSAEGGALGVTIVTAEGFRVTCLPLSELGVAKGESVGAGDTIGVLAGSGDASSAQAHLHVSVRQGESYLDPAKLMTTPEPAASPEPPQAAEPHPAGQGEPAVPAGAASVAAVTADAGGSGVSAAAAAPAIAAPRPVDVPLRASAAVDAVVSCGQAMRATSHAPRPLGTLAHTSGVPALDAALRLYARLRTLVTALAALLVSAACLWPVWRRVSAPVVSSEVAPVRVRS